VVCAEAFDGVAGNVEFVAWAELGEEDLGVDGRDRRGGREVCRMLAEGFEAQMGGVDCRCSVLDVSTGDAIVDVGTV